jgi:hypothetical protein
MEILNSKSIITQTVPRIVETPEHLIINTQVHDKASIKPVPFEFNVISAPISFSCLSRCIWTYNNNTIGRTLFLHSGNNKNQKMYQDTTDINIFYNLFKYPDYGVKLIKFKKEENNISEQWSSMWNVNAVGKTCTGTLTYGNDIQVLFQNDTYMLFVLKYTYQLGGHWEGSSDSYYLKKYNKKTNQTTDVRTLNQGVVNPPIVNYQFIEYNNDNVYFYEQNRNVHTIFKVNLSTNVLTTLLTFTNTNGLSVIDNPVKIGDYYYIIKDNYLQSGIHEYCFYKIRLDVSTDTVTQDVININLNGFTLDTASGEVLSGIGEGVYHTLNTLEINNKKHILCTIHSTPNQNYYPNQHKHIVFEVTDTEIIVKDVITFPNGCKGVLEYIDSRTLVFLYTDSIAFYKFDNTKEKYTLTYRKAGVFNTIGFDTLNKFYMQHNTGAIDVMTSMNACTLKADFADEYYTSINTDTEISFYAKNFLDEYLNADVKITLLGPVQFKDDKSKTKIVKTSDAGVKTLPVTITGSGRIEVVITQLTEN